MTTWVLVILAVLTGGWMLFYGLRAFITGDYTTPSSGPYNGQLGPWAYIIKAVGLEPRSTFMKSVFVMVGLIWLVSAAGQLTSASWTQASLVISAVLSLWFVPFGTAAGIITLAIIFFAH